MARPKVLQLIGSFESGGSELQAVNLAKNLYEDGDFDVYLACLDKRGPLLSKIDWMDQEDIPEFKLSSFYDLNFLKQIGSMAAFIRQNQIDLIHTHDFYTNIFGMFSGARAGLRPRIASKRETLSKSKMQFFAEKQAFRLAKKIVINANAVGDFLTDRGIPKEKLVTIYNGVDPARVTCDAVSAIEDIIAADGGKHIPGSAYITIVANMRSDVKNHKMFLRAAKIVNEQVPDARFILAGEGELLHEYERFAEELGIRQFCLFTGGKVEIGKVLAASTVGVLTSYSEGFSNAIIEYMLAGLPVVATNVGGAAEAVEHEDSGYLIESNDHKSAAIHIIELLQNDIKQRSFGERGLIRAGSLFSVEAQIYSIKCLYTTVLSRQ